MSCGNGRFVAVGATGTVLASAHGHNWAVEESGTADNLSDLIFNGNEFLAVGGRTVTVSTNGLDWMSQIAVPPNTNFTRVAFGNGTFVALATYWHSAPT